MHLTHFGAETHPPPVCKCNKPRGRVPDKGRKGHHGFAHAAGPLAAGLLVFRCLVPGDFLFNFPAEMRVGSLVSGCLFSDHFLPIAVILDTDTVIFSASNLSFGDLVSPFWHPGGASSDPGALGSKRRDTLGRKDLWHIRIGPMVTSNQSQVNP